ncbi:F-box/kelch-repeat protein At3g23880-like isoform X1 [Nicotiana sylvestris]|nr:PREDICTED: F-box/kelch-repeat protein At3g23880-like isoform X1 [Nicotiana sylvestris]XP_016437136.1 PREDICTED: F-box/kelch-repeat protein At3g23880-like isoform X1 [Nicotiana tabacum]
MKKSVANTKKANLFNQIITSSRGDSIQKFNHISKGKSVSNNAIEQMDIVDQAMGIQFEEDIVMEILARLPVRYLFQFTCVSKLWKASISDPYFKKKHLNHAKNDRSSQKLLISPKCRFKDHICSFYSSSLSSLQVVVDEQTLYWPSNHKPVGSTIYCCCDGLVLLATIDGLGRHLLLWNPSTRESIELPHPESPFNDCVCGIGYDSTSDDYKIVAINLDACIDQDVSVEILALKSGSWRKICKYPIGIHRVSGGAMDCGMDSLAFVHGAFHWVGLSRCSTIISLNISSEVYGEIPLIEQMCNTYNAKFIDQGVLVLGGMLCFYYTYYRFSRYVPFKLWVMKDYGVKESWTELHTIQGYDLFFSARPLYMFADGEVLLRCRHFQYFGSVYRTSKGPFEVPPQCPTFMKGLVYTESLISPKSLI